MAVKVRACLALTLVSITLTQQQLRASPFSTNHVVIPPHVLWFTFPTTLPNDADIGSFPIARATLMNGLALYGGNPIATSSRSNNPAGVQFEFAFEAGDMIVVMPSETTNCIWRSQLNPMNTNYVGRLGSRVYVPFIAIANGTNKISLSGFSDSVIDVGGGFFDSQSALETNYTISEVGINKGPSGQLFGNDHIIVTSGSATNLVDAVVFIGARIGADVSQYLSTGVGAVNSYISNGDKFRFIYSYAWNSIDTNGNTVVNIENNERDVMVYQDGQTPSSYNYMWTFETPRGVLFSLEEPETNTYTITTSRDVRGPYTVNSANATTGWSFEWDFTGNSTNDHGFVGFSQNTNASVSSSVRLSSAIHTTLFKPSH